MEVWTPEGEPEEATWSGSIVGAIQVAANAYQTSYEVTEISYQLGKADPIVRLRLKRKDTPHAR